MTGYNLPPGCTVADIERAMGTDQPCAMCGQSADECCCPECPECGAYGDPHCYECHGLVRTPVQDQALFHAALQNARQIAAEDEYWRQLAAEDDPA